MSEDPQLTYKRLAADYDKLIAILDDRIRMPEKTFMGNKAPPSAAFKQCVIDFKSPLTLALQIRTGRTVGVSAKLGAHNVALKDERVSNTLGKNPTATSLLSYLRGEHETTKPQGSELRLATESTLPTLEQQYVFYMTEALQRLTDPKSPCRPFARMKNMIESSTKEDMGLSLADLIARGNKVLATSPDKLYTLAEAAEGAEKAAEAYAKAHPEGGRKTRRRKRSSAGRKRVKMSRRR